MLWSNGLGEGCSQNRVMWTIHKCWKLKNCFIFNMIIVSHDSVSCISRLTWRTCYVENKQKSLLILHILKIIIFSFFFSFFLLEAGSYCVSGTFLKFTIVVQAGFELKNPPAFASQMLGIKMCATVSNQGFLFTKEECDALWSLRARTIGTVEPCGRN